MDFILRAKGGTCCSYASETQPGQIRCIKNISYIFSPSSLSSYGIDLYTFDKEPNNTL
jgi:hypothetical protein